MADQSLDALLTVAEVAAWLGVQPDTIRSWIAWNQLGAVNIGTAARPRYRIPRRAVLQKLQVVRGVDLQA